MKIALVSLNQIWEDKQNNLDICKNYIEKASTIKAELIIFPEMTLTGFTMNIETNSEEKSNSFTIKSFQKLAEMSNIAIVFGLIIKENNKAKNSLYFIDERGEILESYSKIHPFSFVNEDKYFEAGNDAKAIEYKNIKFGLSICYDLRFSNLYQHYTLQNTDCIINIANWPSKRIDHWNTLLKARAIENQQFVIGVNRIGIDGNNLKYNESSAIYNANGENLIFLNQYKDMKIFNISKSYTDEFKLTFNTVQDIKVII